ncbi:MAG: type II toxin-antitoxin system HicA family toxin [Dissulfuribacterales bacterium]
MGKLKVFSGKKNCRILEANGFQDIRMRGSHVVMQKQVAGTTITVPVPDHKEIQMGTLMSIIRQSGINRSEFE